MQDGTLVHVKSKARFAVDADDWKFFNKHVRCRGGGKRKDLRLYSVISVT